MVLEEREEDGGREEGREGVRDEFPLLTESVIASKSFPPMSGESAVGGAFSD